MLRNALALCLVALLFFFVANSSACGPHEQGGLQRWSDPSTWGGTLPVAGDVVNIPSGKKVLYDLSDSPVFSGIDVFGSLVFDQQGTDANFSLNTVYLIMHGPDGILQIGAECCAYQSKATITLYEPADRSTNNYGVGTKVLGVVDGGAVEMFGIVPDPTWNWLAATANKNDTSIKVEMSTSKWKVGDTIVLTPTDFSFTQDEVRVITAIPDDETIVFDSPLKYNHFSEVTYGVDERGEVAHLTRNILIQGDESSIDSQFGGHMMFTNVDHVHVQAVEFTRMGQRNRIGRYPVHFHMAGNLSGKAYVKDCSIHYTFQRCLTIHGTHNLIVRRNVGYNATGHCFFIEDGAETGNEVAWNIAIHNNRVPASEPNGNGLLPSDTSPALFWITNPDNIIRHNVAAGTNDFGFWMALPATANGPSHDLYPDTFPKRTALGEFLWNKAHSCGQDGLMVDSGPDSTGHTVTTVWTPVLNPKPVPNPNNTAVNLPDVPVEAKIQGLIAYKCRNRGAWLRGGLLTLDWCFFADNAIGMTFATNAYYSLVTQSVFVGTTPNYGNPSPYETVGPHNRSLPLYYTSEGANWPIRGYEMYDGPTSVSNCKFINYGVPGSAISMLRKDQFTIAVSNDVKQIRLENYDDNPPGRPVYFPDLAHDGDYSAVFRDLDGSVTGRPPRNGALAAVTNYNPFHFSPNCVNMTNWRAYVCPDHFSDFYLAYSANGVAATNVVFPNASAVAGITEWVKVYRDDHVSQPQSICGGVCPPAGVPTTSTTFFTTVIRNQDYTVHFKNTNAPNKLSFSLLTIDKYQADGSFNELVVGVCYPPGSSLKTVWWNYKNTTVPATSRSVMVSNPVEVDNYNTRGNGMWTQQDADGFFWFRFVPYQNRTTANSRDRYPGAFVFIDVNVGAGSAVCTPRSVGTPKTDDPLPPTGSPASPPDFTDPPPFYDRNYDEQCDIEGVYPGHAASVSSFLVDLVSLVF